MKYGLIDFNLTVKDYWKNSWNKKALLNIGDAAEYLVVEQLYERLGIDSKNIVRLSIRQLTSYRGESLIVPLNIALDSYVGYNDIITRLSPDIIPVFLGMSITSPNMTDSDLERFRCFSPVGCRDERSYLYLKSQNVPCYLNGCSASVLNTGMLSRETVPEVCGKILFIDVPYWVNRFVPDEIKQDIVFLSQEMYCGENEFQDSQQPLDWAKNVFSYYNSKPRLIVTSRFHGAVLALANDIPAIITLEKSTFRFGWLQNYFPIYTEDSTEKISWDSGEADFGGIRGQILSVSERRIRETAQEYEEYLTLTDAQKAKQQAADQAAGSNQVLYYRRAWEAVQSKWRPDTEYSYAFWGVNDNSEMLYALISQNYPRAKLVDVYDMYKSVTFKNIQSKKPEAVAEHRAESNFYLISTAYLSSRVVPDVCAKAGFPEERVFLCKRDFITAEDI